jgi:peptide chain release factor 3
MADMASEIKRRRTFAIISHPDAGKTTITEKILWCGGVIHEAGEVKGKAGTKAAKSDWMKMEQERGVSITSSAMQFDFEGLRVNLLDTPGHKDFGEDTYRTLVAADCAAMLIDAAKGVETQTQKLYEVCRLRKMPIFTYANKMDRDGKSPLDLIDDVESTLQMKCYPVTWPIGMGDRFKGLYHRLEKKLYLYEKGRVEPEIVAVESWEDPKIPEIVGEELYESFCEELELLEGVLGDFDQEEFLAGKVSPMTFGSAKYNWGVDVFLRFFIQHAPMPQSRSAREGAIDPLQKGFSGFVFKIQANMDKRHRDRIAFLRVCSGRFERGMKVKHMRLKRELRLTYANQFLAQDRETVEEAYSGDIVGLNDTGNFQIGDTITDGKSIHFEGIPRFSPEHFGRVRIKDALKKKTLEKGLKQLVDEGTIQVFMEPIIGWQDPILAVVGVLQFDVLLYRLKDEYGLADVILDRLPYTVARWPRSEDGEPLNEVKGVQSMFVDGNENPVILLQREWDLKFLYRENPGVEFAMTSPVY